MVVLDNQTTAMTGHQDHPGTGRTLQRQKAPAFNFEAIALAAGVWYVKTIDPMNLKETEQVIREACSHPGPSVVIAKRACILVERDQFPGALEVDTDLCNQCKLCLWLGCPAISLNNQSAVIDPILCVGCELCAQICQKDAISKHTEE